MNKQTSTLGKKALYFFTFLSLVAAANVSSAQKILLVNDNDYITYNTDTLKSDLDHSTYSTYKYWSIPDSGGVVPTAAFLDTFDLVIWYCSTDGVGLKFWDASTTDCNSDLFSYATTGKPVWIIGQDILYQKYAEGTTFAAGEFAKSGMGLTSYDVQSYVDDGSTGCPEVDRTTTASALFPANVHWVFATDWYIDGCTADAGTREIYAMGPSSYALNGKKCMFHNLQPGLSIMSTFFDPALIDTFTDRITFMQQSITYLLGTSASVPQVTLSNTSAIYPNPATTVFTLDISNAKAGPATIELLDVSGRKVKQQKVMLSNGRNVITTDLNAVNAGLYMVRVTGDAGQTLYWGKLNKL